jgi:actin related protein 2/3 complex subunit 1A/1B
MTEVHHLAQTITCHAFNADRSRLALCPNNNEIHIFSRQDGQWVLESILKEHDQTVLGLDWAPKTNRIVSCSQDRNAYVWTEAEPGRWKPTLVILRINRAATHVRWSPQENKFAVASGAKLVSVCYFEEDNDWWVSKHIKKHRSTVLSVDWHPNNLLLATGSSDFRARIFSAAIKGVDKSPKSDLFPNKPTAFGECLAEFDQVQGWVHSVAWSPSGQVLAFTGHDSRIAFADCRQDPPVVQVIKLSGLPLTSLIFASETSVIGAGHECNPYVFSKQGNQWAHTGKLDKTEAAQAKGAVDAKTKFQNLEKTGQEVTQTVLNTKHQNTIKTITAFQGQPGNLTQIATSGIDGKIIIWPTKA